ncbi:MAG: twin-arginine translocation signal domain-containing protein [candidate division Zixibacteria bacterium]|nr:twin-arginine translocation signal domain-containing protein [candidate division Zixibacteria bacterium]
MDKNRRDFLKAGGILTAAAATMPSVFTTSTAFAQQPSPIGRRGTDKHTLPGLNYAYDALEPYIDAKTMELHHSKHHQGYVDGLNKAEAELRKARASGDYSLVQHWSRKVAFNGGGHYLHTLFWATMAPPGKGGGGEPKGVLARNINEDFGSFKAFKEHFSAAAKSVEGSGWGVLHVRLSDHKLIVLQVENHQKLSPWGVAPILDIDVWEHAYYLKYQNKRGEFIDAWWNVVNWDQVEKNYLTAIKG